MTGPLLLAAAWTLRPALTFVTRTTSTRRTCLQRLFASEPSSSLASLVESRISRLGTLQTLLQKQGAPGSQGCRTPDGDLVPVIAAQETPELVASMGATADSELVNLHPYLFPIAQSQSTGNLVCAYRNPATEESSKITPWPIVEAKMGGPGMQLLSLNSEHLMRRIVCEFDAAQTNADLIALYNEGLGQGLLKEAALDTPYEPGSVAKLGYGVDKYVLLRVGPFPDLYERMARQHFARGDEASALIAAETANGKLSGFASTFRFYARLLSSFPNRQEETRDAARMCLRLPLPTIGMAMADFEEVAMLGQMADESDSPVTALNKLRHMYTLIKQVEDDDPHAPGKTVVQQVLEDANNLINDTVLAGKEWSSIRPKLGELFRSIGRDEMAAFIDF
jgi:hypothetical protein